MSTEAARAAIAARFQAGWTGPGALPVEYENLHFKPPEGAPWCRFSIQWGERDSVAVGGTRKRQVGILSLQIFMPETGGTKAATVATDKLAEIFDSAQIVAGPGLVVTFDQVGGPEQAGTRTGYQQQNAAVSFYVDKTT